MLPLRMEREVSTYRPRDPRLTAARGERRAPCWVSMRTPTRRFRCTPRTAALPPRRRAFLARSVRSRLKGRAGTGRRRPMNLKVLPDDTSPDRLRATMRGFTGALGRALQLLSCRRGGQTPLDLRLRLRRESEQGPGARDDAHAGLDRRPPAEDRAERERARRRALPDLSPGAPASDDARGGAPRRLPQGRPEGDRAALHASCASATTAAAGSTSASTVSTAWATSSSSRRRRRTSRRRSPCCS